ncbi:MAG: hypothetical protein JSV19_02795 [Phycisphaerales bacterium]|nr:MAG: hypothetical protein JSV19_02795 [Phycisphaerales bacterium]
MIRKTVFRGTLFGVFAIITLMLVSLDGRVGCTWGNKPTLPFGDVALTWGDLIIHHYRRGPCGPHYGVGFGGFQLQDYNNPFLLMEDRSLQAGFWSASNVQRFYMCLPLWMPLVILGAWPLLASVRGPLHRHRRRRQRQRHLPAMRRAGMIYRQARLPAWVAESGAFVCFCLMLCIAFGLAARLLNYISTWFAGHDDVRTVACIVVSVVCSYAVSRKLYRTLRRRTFDGAPRCVRCGYDLTGNVSGVCPECGEPTADRSSSDAD